MYDYLTQKPHLLTDNGQREFLEVRDHVNDLLDKAGAVRMDAAISGSSGDSWNLLACVDRLVELGEIREVTGNVAGQHRVLYAPITAIANW